MIYPSLEGLSGLQRSCARWYVRLALCVLIIGYCAVECVKADARAVFCPRVK